jgi:hypothetical protein
MGSRTHGQEIQPSTPKKRILKAKRKALSRSKVL